MRVIRDNYTKVSKGIGYVNFEDIESVNKAVLKENEVKIGDRTLRIKKSVT